MTKSEDGNKRFKIEAQKMRMEEEQRVKNNALQAVINRTNRQIEKECFSDNGQNSSTLIPA
ncbi:hypothetical protein [Gracilimonas tropica]|uniref:hypothetical protein n=1 Tax=Gracilimonas tropica TaxID=454600 RepID=UPI00036E4A44|nr:hypothetical protein [Gracilimonas tropica]